MCALCLLACSGYRELKKFHVVIFFSLKKKLLLRKFLHVCTCIRYDKSVQEWVVWARACTCNSNRSPHSNQSYWTVQIKHPITCLATMDNVYAAYTGHATIFSTGSKFWPVSNFTELHALTLATHSYALLLGALATKLAAGYVIQM